MEPENSHPVAESKPTSHLTQVTSSSKYLAMALFVILPFAGGYVGYTFAPEKIVEVERVVTKEMPASVDTSTSGMFYSQPVLISGVGANGLEVDNIEILSDQAATDYLLDEGICVDAYHCDRIYYRNTEKESVTVSVLPDAVIYDVWGRKLTYTALKERVDTGQYTDPFVLMFNAENEVLGINGVYNPH